MKTSFIVRQFLVFGLLVAVLFSGNSLSENRSFASKKTSAVKTSVVKTTAETTSTNSDKKPSLDALEEKAFKLAVAMVAPSVVRIQTIGGLDKVGNVLTGTGPTTGVIVSKDGYIISSSFNFISKPSSIMVWLSSGQKHGARVVATDKVRMLTLLKIDAKDLTPPMAAAQKSVKVGHWSLAVGRTFKGAAPSISVGIVSALRRISGKAIQTDAKISPVNYGGPLVSIEGKVQGILVPLSARPAQGATAETAGSEWYDSGIGFAIPMEDALDSYRRLKLGRDLHPGLLGIGFKARGAIGGEAVISRVRNSSPAAKAGLRVGDRIIQINERKILGQHHVKQSLGSRYAGDSLNITFVRKGKKTRQLVTLSGKLQPYESSYLGIIPFRKSSTETAKSKDVRIRHVEPKSPAAIAKLKKGDYITTFNKQKVTTAAMLLELMNRHKPGTKVTIGFLRNEGKKAGAAVLKAHTASVTLGTVPNSVSTNLSPEAFPPLATPTKGTGKITAAATAKHSKYWAYIPENYDPAYKYSLMVWLHPSNSTMEQGMSDRWKKLCARWHIIILAPAATQINGKWGTTEFKTVQQTIEKFAAGYSIDSSRLFLHGFGDSANFTFKMAFRHRELFRGVCMAAGVLSVPPMFNSPDYRLQFHFVCGEKDEDNPRVKASADLLKTMKFPTSYRSMKGVELEYPTGKHLDEIARWIDSLSRI